MFEQLLYLIKVTFKQLVIFIEGQVTQVKKACEVSSLYYTNYCNFSSYVRDSDNRFWAISRVVAQTREIF